MIKLDTYIFKDSHGGRVFISNEGRVYAEVVLCMDSIEEITDTYHKVEESLKSARLKIATGVNITINYIMEMEDFKKSFVNFFLTYKEQNTDSTNNMYVYPLKPIILKAPENSFFDF